MERAEDTTGTLRVAAVWALKRLTEQRMQQPEGAPARIPSLSVLFPLNRKMTLMATTNASLVSLSVPDPDTNKLIFHLPGTGLR